VEKVALISSYQYFKNYINPINKSVKYLKKIANTLPDSYLPDYHPSIVIENKIKIIRFL